MTNLLKIIQIHFLQCTLKKKFTRFQHTFPSIFQRMNSVPGAQLYSMGSKYQDIIFIFSLVETTPKYENYLETAINYTLLQIFRGKKMYCHLKLYVEQIINYGTNYLLTISNSQKKSHYFQMNFFINCK